jgi:hypothetical protein
MRQQTSSREDIIGCPHDTGKIPTFAVLHIEGRAHRSHVAANMGYILVVSDFIGI